MSAISGFFGLNAAEEEKRALAEAMSDVQKRSEQDPMACFVEGDAGIAGKACNMWELRTENRRVAAVLDGEFYNKKELSSLLSYAGESLTDGCDGELAVRLYLRFGLDFVKKVNGVFAMAIADSGEQRMILYRDRIGAKPLFYAERGERLYFSSLLKGLFVCPGVEPVIDWIGLNEIFSMGPARTPGNAVFRNIRELEPAHVLICTPESRTCKAYWKLESHPHEDDYETTVETVTDLVLDAITRQTEAEQPVCTFLSGGVDSSLVSSVCAGILKKQGKVLQTFSFDFKDNDKYFKSNAFQPSRDLPYVEAMVRYLGSEHHYLECESETQVQLLPESVRAADLPVMADIDSSLLYFCRQVAEYNSTALTGECADEIFGGYPWFHKKELLEADTFPWTKDLEARKVLLKEDFLRELSMEDYVRERYEESLAAVPLCPEDSKTDAHRRNISWLNLKWFMQTLLNRMDRTSRDSGLTARVPFADHRIIEYLWNIPWDMKAKDGVVKNLLRESGRGLLPDEVLCRRKSPYPKTYVPHYEAMLAKQMREILEDGSAPVNQFLDREKTLRFLEAPSDYGRPWYGQLMAAPQMLAYMIQVNEWLKRYQIRIQNRTL